VPSHGAPRRSCKIATPALDPSAKVVVRPLIGAELSIEGIKKGAKYFLND
jgi:hypothetical protein